MKKKSSNISLFTVILQTILALLSVVRVVRGFVNKSYDESVLHFVTDILFMVGWSFLSADGFKRLHRNKKEEKSTEDSTGESEEM